MFDNESNNYLRVAEMFYSIQGEGPTAGRRAVFLRLQGCNLMCGGAETVRDGELHDGAAWRCDTIEVWTKGRKLTHGELLNEFRTKGFLDELKNEAHLIITGGEPLLQQKRLIPFLGLLRAEVPNLYVEVETNGTIPFDIAFFTNINQVNCSPKLRNAGLSELPYDSAQVDSILRAHKLTLVKICFKFVVGSREDVLEIFDRFPQLNQPNDYFHVNNNSHFVWLMPYASSREELQRNGVIVAELAKEFRCSYSSRLQVELWDKTTGV